MNEYKSLTYHTLSPSHIDACTTLTITNTHTLIHTPWYHPSSSHETHTHTIMTRLSFLQSEEREIHKQPSPILSLSLSLSLDDRLSKIGHRHSRLYRIMF